MVLVTRGMTFLEGRGMRYVWSAVQDATGGLFQYNAAPTFESYPIHPFEL